MRLLNARTLQLEEFFNNPSKIPDYVILSHTWGNEEVTLEHMRSGLATHKRGFAKIRFACEQACRDGYSYAWVDTCCIDKSSSAELSEAINSMFEWYRRSMICYAYLEGIFPEDVDDCGVPEDYHLVQGQESDYRESKFAQHRWFRRGWTLQELIAPSRVEFYGQNWAYLGSSLHLIDEIVFITGIDENVLSSNQEQKMEFLRRASVAQRMSWAASRHVTRPEDEAYCLLGIFGVHMPLLYGEGSAAFLRLQEEILKISDDHSIFAWPGDRTIEESLLLAPHVSCFRKCGTIIAWREEATREPFSMTNAGLSITLPIYLEYIAILSCRYADEASGPIGLLLRRVDGRKGLQSFHVARSYGRIDEAVHKNHNLHGRTVIFDRAKTRKSFGPERLNILLLRQQPTDFSIPVTGKALAVFKPDVPTVFSVDSKFGAPDLRLPAWLRLPFSKKAFYPSLHWREAPLTGTDTLLLPIQVDVGAVRISYRYTSFVVMFGLEKRNWHREALEAWIRIHSVDGDLTMREIVQEDQRIHHEDGFATKKWGSIHSFTPKQFPDDRIEISVVRNRIMGDFTFQVHGKANKMTISGLDFPPPSEDADESQIGTAQSSRFKLQIELPGWRSGEGYTEVRVPDNGTDYRKQELEELERMKAKLREFRRKQELEEKRVAKELEVAEKREKSSAGHPKKHKSTRFRR